MPEEISAMEMPVVKKVKLISWLIVGIGAIFYCYEYFLRISPSVMARQLMDAYHLGGEGFGNMTAFYYYAYTPMQFAVGILMDRYGPRRLLTMACASCALGTYIFSVSHYTIVGDIGRFFIGFGSAFAFVGAMKLATIWLPSNRFAFLSGLITTLGMIGAMIGDVVLTDLVHYTGWRETIYLAAILGVILTIVIFLCVRDKNPDAVTVSQEDQKNMEFGPLFRGLGKALLKPQMWVAGIIGALLYSSLAGFAELWGIPFLKTVHHLRSIDAASLNTSVFLGWAIGAPIIGIVSDRLRRRRAPIIICTILAFVDISLVLYLPYHSVMLLYVLLTLFGILCSAEVLAFPLGKEINNERMAGISLALINAMVMMSGVIFPRLIGYILDLGWGGQMLHGVRLFSATDYQIAMSVLPVCMLLAFVLSLFVRETFCDPDYAKKLAK